VIADDCFIEIRRFAKKHTINPSDFIGFYIDASDSKEFRFRFIIKEEIVDEVLDPFGQIIKNTRIIFDISHLRIQKGSNLLEVMNPGRKFKRLLQFIINQSDGEIHIDPMSQDFEKMIKRLTEESNRLDILGVETRDFLIKSRTTCKARFRALVDVRKDVDYFLNSRSYDISFARLEAHRSGQNYTLDVYDSGRHVVNFDPYLLEHQWILEALSSSLEEEK
jgi:hypothetical protein